MIVDLHDDLGTFLRQSNPDLASSDFVKSASWEERTDIYDRDFAIILVEDNGREHRKLAMTDAGNTLASIVYFLTNDHDLPDGAVKLAAANLLNSAMHYGLYDYYGDSLLFNEKLGSAFDVLAVLADSLPQDGILDERRVAVKTAYAGQAQNYRAPIAGQQSAPIGKTSPTVMHTANSINMRVPGGASSMPGKTTVASTFDLIKEAEWSWPELDPVDRREFALIIKEAAKAEGAHVPAKIAQYGGHELNPDFETLMHRRLDYVSNPDLVADYQRFSKVAFAMDLADATEALYLLDEQAGLLDRYGSNLPDPVLSIYGCSTKEAMWSWNHGGDYCTGRELEMLVKDPVKRRRMEDMFTEKVCCAFMDDPVKSFESMPLEQQIIVARMANTSEF